MPKHLTQPNSTISMRASIIILLAACFYLYEFILQVAPGAIAQELMQDLATNATGLGIISGCFYFVYTPLQLVNGLLLDRYSTRIILTTVATACAGGALLFAWAPNLYLAAIARGIMGGASACAFIGVLHLAIRWAPLRTFALFAGIAEMMGALGGLLGSKPFAILLQFTNWRIATTGFAILGLLLAGLISAMVVDKPAPAISQPKPPSIQKSRSEPFWQSLHTIMRNPATWSIGAYSFLIWAPILGFAALWGAPFLKLSFNLNNIQANHAISVIWIGIAIGSPCIGWLSERMQRCTPLMGGCAWLGTLALSIVLFSPQLTSWQLNLLMLIIGIASAGQTLAFVCIRDHTADHHTGTANGFNNMWVVAGGLIFPIVIGWILDQNWQGAICAGIREYGIQSYRTALAILPLCYLFAGIISTWFIHDRTNRQ